MCSAARSEEPRIFLTTPRTFKGCIPTGATWDVETLARFIEEPRALAPNTNMPNLHLTRAQAIDIAKALSGLK